MLHVALPLGTTHGWGIVGRMIVRELAKLAPIELHADDLKPELAFDELEFRFLRSLLPAAALPKTPSGQRTVPGPVLRSTATAGSFCPELRGTFNVGYAVFELDRLANSQNSALCEFDHLVTGSTWCADVLRSAGFQSVSTALQGVEQRFFNPQQNEKEFFRDRFIVFSGGKMEFRKGQDLVIRAFGILQQRHRDVMLINSWFNYWRPDNNLLAQFRHIHVPAVSGDHVQIVNRILAHNCIDLSGVITLGAQPNPLMAAVYKNTDIGLFPNRCEGATNMVLCEYMACGKPVIASFNTGHCDVLTDRNSLRLRAARPIVIQEHRGETIGTWYESDLDEIVEKLEWAYRNRDALAPLAQQAADDMSKLTWNSTARHLCDVLTRA